MQNIRRFPCLGAALAALLIAGTGATSAVAAGKKIPTHEDIWLMKRIGAPQVSPDGRWIVVPVAEPSYDENSQLSDLWLVDTSARNFTRRITSTRRPESGVVWSPDSRRIVFSAQRDNDDAPQLYSLDLAQGGEAQRLTNLSGGARAPVFSHDGRQIAFVAIMYPQAADDAANKALLAEHRARKSSARIYEGFPIRNWDRWLDERQVRIFVQGLDEDGQPSGPPRDLLAGTRLAASPGFAGRQTDTGEELEMEFTPDNKSVVFAATTNLNEAARAFTDSQLFVVDVAGGEPRAITTGMNSWSLPKFTPDGSHLLAVVEEQGGSSVYNLARLAAFNWPQPGEPRIVTHGIDRAVGGYAVTPDSRTVYFTAEDAGNEKLFSVRVGGGTVQTVFGVEEGSYNNIAIPRRADNLAIYGTWESASSPAEVALISPQNGKALVLTRFNAQRVARLDLPPIQNFWFTSSRGKRIHSFVVRPPGFDASKKYPLFVVIHGGPHGMWRDQFFIRWNYHLLAAPGYVLLLTNYSGSTGFGEEFSRSIQGDPLKGPADEINEAADAAIRHFGFIDGTRQCAGGASYGGHLANWLQGTTTRYKCLVSHAGLVNLEAQWGTSDTIYSREVNMGGPPWDQGAVWRSQNPIRFAGNFRTPVLVTVGENDFRVPLNNALEYWSALQRMKVPSRFVVFPDENHWIQKGENSRLFYSELAAWLARWLGPPG
ncbi:MAG TPA: S9 family peptidase [Steroidobacteraceae bacterium]|jgi:dipeptidyl aminopeptidase/acylaminoacyl peptidase|nr:S9 family peptidase [Steroidobacteraceae bacterium]